MPCIRKSSVRFSQHEEIHQRDRNRCKQLTHCAVSRHRLDSSRLDWQPFAWGNVALHAHVISKIFRFGDEQSHIFTWMFFFPSRHLLDIDNDVEQFKYPKVRLIAQITCLNWRLLSTHLHRWEQFEFMRAQKTNAIKTTKWNHIFLAKPFRCQTTNFQEIGRHDSIQWHCKQFLFYSLFPMYTPISISRKNLTKIKTDEATENTHSYTCWDWPNNLENLGRIE